MDYTAQEIIDALVGGDKKITVMPKEEVKLLTYHNEGWVEIDNASIRVGSITEMELKNVQITGQSGAAIPWLFVKGTNNGLSLDWFAIHSQLQDLEIEISG